MTQDQIEILREAIASRSVEYEDIVASLGHALQECMQAVDYEDWSHAQNQAQYVADVLKTLARSGTEGRSSHD